MCCVPQALCSAVVQVYAADRSFSWAKRCCGVACLVKDNTQRSYYIRVLDIKVGGLPPHGQPDSTPSPI